jgi:hypothetical protein
LKRKKTSEALEWEHESDYSLLTKGRYAWASSNGYDCRIVLFG